MCGIFCALYKNVEGKSLGEEALIKCQKLLKNRGPDIQGCEHVNICESSGIILHGTTLHMRGVRPTTQPLNDLQGNLLVWNGEIFDGIKVMEDENDGQILLKLLSSCKSESNILEIFGKVHGPYSFIYWQASSRKLWFGRDALGRRSLLVMEGESSLVMSSVAFESKGDWKEIPASGIYCLEMNKFIEEYDDKVCSTHLTLYPWLWSSECLRNDSKISSSWSEVDLFNYRPSTKCFESLALSPVGIWCQFCKLNSRHEEFVAEASLAECVLRDFATEARKTASRQLLLNLCESIRKRTRSSSVPNWCSDCLEGYFLGASENPNSSTEDPSFSSRLRNEVEDSGGCNHAKVAVLFSGGIDSLILAAIVDRFISPNDPIDLLNVSFVDKGALQAPDRLTGIEGFKELKTISPNRVWNFVEINVTLDKLQEKRRERIRHLLKPLDTVLDDSIGCAIWFAAEGQGHIRTYDDDDDDTPLSYSSPARVLLLGMGADELFAGYSRHRMKFMNEGWQGLAQELQSEIQNISSRNMGRDDRIVSDHSKEARFPYLDEHLVNFVLSLNMDVKFDLNHPRGVGEKLLLRLLALDLGLKNGATLRKRAIQFGSRIAKLESRKEKANQKCLRLQN